MIENKNEFGTLQEIELNDFENGNDIKLPDDYREFLLKFNGGKPDHNNVENNMIVSYFLGMHNGEYYANLYKHIAIFKERLPLSTFPIATDPFGNLYLMSLHPDGYGHIYFWDNEGEPEHQDGHHVANCTFVAWSFSEFIGKLKS